MRTYGLKGQQRQRGTLGVALLSTALAGCASGENAERFLVAPDKYRIYNCAQLTTEAQVKVARRQELERLMAKAGPDSGAQFVIDLTYRPEYLQVRGEINELRKTAAEKNCKFTPGFDAPSGRTSDDIVR